MESILAKLAACPVLRGLPEPGLAEAAEMARVRRFDVNEPIFAKGDRQTGLCVVTAGAVRISSVNAAGREAMLIIMPRGGWFGEAVFAEQAPRVYDVITHEPAEIIELPGVAFRALLARYPESYPVILDQVSRRLWAAMSIIEDDALRGKEARLVRRLLFLAEISGQETLGAAPLHLRLTREHLANMMGMTRQGVHGVIQGLAASGLIALDYGRITLNDPAALNDYIATLD